MMGFRISREAGPSRRLPAIGRWLMSTAFVTVAGAVALQMAWDSGADDLRRWTAMGIVAAGLAVLAFGPGMTIGRRRYVAALFLLPVWSAVIVYNSLSALEFFDRYLADAEARTTRAAITFRDARDDLKRLRDRRATIITGRAVATIEAEITKRQLLKQGVATLEIELADARSRDDLDGRIAVAARRFSGTDATGDGDAGRHLAPVFQWLSLKTGVVVASAKDVRALLLLLITEMGAAFVPLAMAMASGGGVKWSIRRTAPADPAPAAKPQASPGPVRPDVRQIMTWLDARTTRTAGAKVPAAELYADYDAWCRTRGQTPEGRTRFGVVLSGEGGLAKRKAGAAWTVCYLGIALRPPVASRGGALVTAMFGAAPMQRFVA